MDIAELKPVASSAVSPVVYFLNNYPEVSVRITGHTCWLRTNECDLGRARRRADALTDWLISRDIDRDRLFFAAESESQPIDTNLAEDDPRTNRRFEVVQVCRERKP